MMKHCVQPSEISHNFSLLSGKVPDDVAALQPFSGIPSWVTANPPTSVIRFKKSHLDPLTLEEAMEIFKI